MDHGGQVEKEGRVMSHVQVGGVDFCDNLPTPEALTAQTRNLNETNTLTQTHSVPPLQNEDGGGCGLIQKASLSNNGKDMVEEQAKEEYAGRGSEEDDEDDIDEVMKEEEEEEESEESSCLNRCQSPDTQMTDSSYSETGSLLETPYPFSPGTSPEPTSPVIPVVSLETAYPIGQVQHSDVNVDSQNSNTESVACTSGPVTQGPRPHSATLTITSDTRPTSPPGPTCISEATDRIAKNTNFTTDHLTSSTGPVFNHGLTCASSYAGPITSTAETFTVTACTTRLNTFFASDGTESTSSTGPITSNWEHITSTPMPTCVSVSTCATGPIPSPALLESLEQLAQRGDDTHLPQYLHQIAEAFVLHKDYQRALWCIQLERDYHQRVLDNLNALQQQWEGQGRKTSSDLATPHLDTLKHICQTHSRPRARDAVCASLDLLRPSFEEGGALPPHTSACQVGRGTEQRAGDSSCSQSSQTVIPSINLADGLNSPEISGKDRGDPGRDLEGRGCFHGAQLTDRQGSNREGGEAEGGVGYTISVIGNELHPCTAGEMDQSKPAEQQGGDLGLAQEREAKREEEERDVEEAAEALEMEDEGEDDEEEKQKKVDFPSCQKALPVETLVGGAEVEVQQLHQEALAEEKLHEDTQSTTTKEAHLPQEAHMKQQEQCEEEEEEEEEYDVEQVDIIREAASLDDMAKLITVEEMSPTPGLVSILKKRSICVDNVSVSASSQTRPAKRRVHFKVPDESYEQEVGSGDSCLLLFLLCLVTVVISVGGTALYCALGDAHSSVCQDFSRNADFYIGQIQRGIAHVQHWFTPGS
ncbi:consortin isoform X1 [Micropterus salmoides]|uniref:consortin isoform X1 n=1 Tax=Micropterus salmoides TaxID=27706 RepID=UPI0018ED24CC|nr:consortin isoform X1 [Micropterus salmoides]XP_038557176.1 consortin isoform X1 [Micropterus salmoides]